MSISSGIKVSSCIISDSECWFEGAILTNGSTDSIVIFYDSADDDLGGKLEVGYISQVVPSFDYKIHCSHGLYAEVSEGAEFLAITG